MTSRWLVTALILATLAAQLSNGARINKSRRKAMSMLSGAAGEVQLHFSSCDQSSNSEACVMAMDSTTGDEYSQCAHTHPEKRGAFWRGYLENPSYVSTVHILNSDWRKLGMKDGLLEFTIGGSDQVCVTYSSNESFVSKTFPCDILTSFIEIKSSIDDAALVLCDVTVQGAALTFSSVLQYPPPPLKFGGCDQSSVEKTYNCWLAVDEMTDQQANRGACAMTQAGNFEWWSANLEQPALVQQVVIFNRVDCCQEHLVNFAVTIGGQQCARYNTPTPFASKTFKCNLFGSNIRIQMMASNVRLTLCEVQVLGHVVDMTPDSRRTFHGCYIDKPEDPDLSEPNEPVSLTSMELNKCEHMCRRLGKKYFGVQEGMLCWCGNSYGKYGKVENEECGMKCEGKTLQYCGGVHRSLIFELH